MTRRLVIGTYYLGQNCIIETLEKGVKTIWKDIPVVPLDSRI